MSAPKCFVLFVVVVQLVDHSVKCMPVNENGNAQALTNYPYPNPYFRGGGQIARGYGPSNWGGNRPMPYPGGLGPGFDNNSGYVPIGTGYIPPPGGGSTGIGGGFDPGFDGSGLGGSGLGGSGLGGSGSGGSGSGGFGGEYGGSPGVIGGFDTGFDGSHLGRPSGGFDGGFDGSHLGGSVVQTPNFDVRSG